MEMSSGKASPHVAVSVPAEPASVGKHGSMPMERPKIPLTRILKEARPEVTLLSLGLVTLVISAVAMLAVPFWFGRIVDALVSNNGKSDQEDALRGAVIGLCLSGVVGAVFTALRGYIFNYAGERVVARLRKKLMARLLSQDIAFHDVSRPGELLSRLAADSSTLQDAATTNISMAMRWLASVVGGMIYLAVLQWKLTLMLLLLVPACVLVAVGFGNYLRKASKAARAALGAASAVASESFAGIRTIRAFANEPAMAALYDKRVDETLALGKKSAAAYGGFVGTVTLIMLLAFAGVLFYGGKLVLDGELTAGDLTSFLLYAVSIGGALAGLAGLFGKMMTAAGACDRVFSLLDQEPTLALTGGRVLPAGSQCRVEFRDVGFTYPSRRDDKRAVSGLTFTLEPGTRTALVGASGGGKSTVAALLQGLYHPDEGTILIDGVPLPELDASLYRRRMGVISQEPTLFNGTIRNNIAFGAPQSTLQEIEAAAEAANAKEFIERLPDTWDARIGTNGVLLSGGQKQRCAIARALLVNPQLIIQDEATSALDAASEHQVQAALNALAEGRTTLTIAHRLSTVRDADQILVLRGGRIAERGTHDELLALNGVYTDLVQHQMVASQSP